MFVLEYRALFQKGREFLYEILKLDCCVYRNWWVRVSFGMIWPSLSVVEGIAPLRTQCSVLIG